MIKIIFLAAATVLTVLLLVAIIKGKAYYSFVDNLESSEYFLKDLYIIGFYFNSIPLFTLRGKLTRELKKNARLIHDKKYADYYALLAWARFLTGAVIVLTFACAVCGLVEKGYIAAVFLFSAVAVILIWKNSMSKMKDLVQKRREDCEYEFSDMVSKLSLLINSGMVFREAWFFVANSKSGTLYDLMKDSCSGMNNGMSEREAIHKFGVTSDSVEIKKFTSTVLQGMEKGNSELAELLIVQASEQLARKRQAALQKGEIAAGKLIIPVTLSFIGIILIVMASAFQGMAF